MNLVPVVFLLHYGRNVGGLVLKKEKKYTQKKTEDNKGISKTNKSRETDNVMAKKKKQKRWTTKRLNKFTKHYLAARTPRKTRSVLRC